MNAQELGNALYGLQEMTSDYPEVIAASDILCIFRKSLYCSEAIQPEAINLLRNGYYRSSAGPPADDCSKPESSFLET